MLNMKNNKQHKKVVVPSYDKQKRNLKTIVRQFYKRMKTKISGKKEPVVVEPEGMMGILADSTRRVSECVSAHSCNEIKIMALQSVASCTKCVENEITNSASFMCIINAATPRVSITHSLADSMLGNIIPKINP